MKNGNILTVSWFSAGVSSAVATWLVRDHLDRVVYIHIDDQHPDTMRFVRDCETWIGHKIEVIQSPLRTVANAWLAARKRIPIKPGGYACCTYELKTVVRKLWERKNRYIYTFRYVWGMDSTELERRDRLFKTMPDVQHIFPLIHAGITKEKAHDILRDAGIKRPAMYDMGYPNNNCIGCLKGGMWYWNKIRVDYPEVFRERAALERKKGASCLKNVFLDELDPTAGITQYPVGEKKPIGWYVKYM